MIKSSQNTLLTCLGSAQTVSFQEVLEALLPTLPLLAQLKHTLQEFEWHAEGNVAIHSAMVLEQAYLLANEAELLEESRTTVLLSAALHDIGKALTTREELDEQGRMRLRSRKHARRGRDYLSFRLLETGFAPKTILNVLNLVAEHHSIHRALENDLGRGVYALARRVPLPLLALVAKADSRGRTVFPEAKLTQAEENIELLQLMAEELGIWNKTDPYDEFKAQIIQQLPDAEPDLLSLAISRGIEDWEASAIHTPHEAVARIQQAAKDGFPRLTVLCGPSGSGKSTHAKQIAARTGLYEGPVEIVNLDRLRAQLGKNSQDQSVNGQVMQAAREAVRVGLRKKAHVVWDACSLRRDQRAQVLQLGRDYGALTRIEVLWVAPSQFQKRNQERDRVVHPAVIEDQLSMLEFPEVTEAHEVVYGAMGRGL